MKNLKKKRRIQIVSVAVVALALSTALIGYAMRDGINFFRAPSDIIAEPPSPTEVFRLGGLVAPGSVVRGDGYEVRFVVTDGAADIPVVFAGVLPDLFAEGEGMVGMGRLEDGVFRATEILAKHDETYMPREVAEALQRAGHWKPEDGAAALQDALRVNAASN